MLQFIGPANYFRDHVPNLTEMVKPLRDMILLGYQQAISNCSELYFLEDTAKPILQIDVSDYLYMMTKTLVGAQSNWSTRVLRDLLRC
jgi:hypothetical protein